MINVHLGDIITKVMKQKGITPSELARKLDVSVQAMYKILRRDMLDPFRVEQISIVLDYNFYQHIYIPPKEVIQEQEPDEMQKLLKENEELKKEIIYLREINELLKRQKQ